MHLNLQRKMLIDIMNDHGLEQLVHRGARWLSGRVSDSGARGQGFDTYRRRVVSLSKHFTPRKYWLITQEAVAPSRHD